MKKSLVFIFVLLSASAYSQITLHFKDSVSKEPAPYIMVLNKNNEIITASNDLGEVFLSKDDKLTNSIILESIFYETKEINLDDIENNSTIILTPMVNVLDEVTLIPKKKYLVLTAYFRVYNITDGILRTFVDAEVKYIKKKNSLKKKVLSFRIFDTTSKEEYKQNFPYWVPNLNKRTLFDEVNSKFYLIKNKKEDLINIVSKKNNEVLGTIKNDTNLEHNSNILITAKEEKGEYYTIINTAEYNSDELLSTSIEDLKYKYKMIKRMVTPERIKKYPELKGKKILINIKEIFIQNVEYISKKEYKQIMKMGYKDTSVSHYSKEFWKNLETFSPLEPALQKQLDEILIERK